LDKEKRRAVLQQFLAELQKEEFVAHTRWILLTRQIEHINKHLEALEGS